MIVAVTNKMLWRKFDSIESPIELIREYPEIEYLFYILDGEIVAEYTKQDLARTIAERVKYISMQGTF